MIKTLLLKNGLEVIADVEEVGDLLRLNKPFKIIIASVPLQTPQGLHVKNMPTMVPLLSTCVEDRITLPASDVALQLTTLAEIATAYVKRTTGIEIAPAGLQV